MAEVTWLFPAVSSTVMSLPWYVTCQTRPTRSGVPMRGRIRVSHGLEELVQVAILWVPWSRP